MARLFDLPDYVDPDEERRHKQWQGLQLDIWARRFDTRCLEDVGRHVIGSAEDQARTISADKRIGFIYTGSNPVPETGWTETVLSMVCKIYVEDSRTQLENEGIIRGQPRDQFLSLVIFCGHEFPKPAEVELTMVQSLIGQILRLCGFDFFDNDALCTFKFSTTSWLDHYWFVFKSLVRQLPRQITVIYYNDNPAELPAEIFDSFILGKLVALYKEQTDLAKEEEKAQFLLIATDPSEFGDFRISEAVEKMGLEVKAFKYYMESTETGESLRHSAIIERR
ncbi:hypothetical protein CNYM01_05608 [Colletotrichum nymphaeae SA-01]|uniref:Uncharacterized protein n=1 Tax=Colletotrichum nymphaeae SA-01 TaxID=1460502 RepID=A0A135SXU2_9PEZI|nr:hypothetical protein CNYM01_05608 [Colletotrichum nymphaeae SA-01]